MSPAQRSRDNPEGWSGRPRSCPADWRRPKGRSDLARPSRPDGSRRLRRDSRPRRRHRCHRPGRVPSLALLRSRRRRSVAIRPPSLRHNPVRRSKSNQPSPEQRDAVAWRQPLASGVPARISRHLPAFVPSAPRQWHILWRKALAQSRAQGPSHLTRTRPRAVVHAAGECVVR